MSESFRHADQLINSKLALGDIDLNDSGAVRRSRDRRLMNEPILISALEQSLVYENGAPIWHILIAQVQNYR